MTDYMWNVMHQAVQELTSRLQGPVSRVVHLGQSKSYQSSFIAQINVTISISRTF